MWDATEYSELSFDKSIFLDVIESKDLGLNSIQLSSTAAALPMEHALYPGGGGLVTEAYSK